MAGFLLLLALIQLVAWLVPAAPGSKGITAYLPFHTLLETVSIVISMMVFSVGWNSHNNRQSGNVVLLACVFFSVGVLDFLHTVSYGGMPDFITPNDPQKHLYFWLAARFLASAALLVVIVRPWRTILSGVMRYATFVVSMIVVLLISYLVWIHQGWLLDMFIPGQGLTTSKKAIEYAVILINLITASIAWRRLRQPQPYNVVLLFGAVCVMAMSEFFFTLYTTMTGSYNVLGHIYKAIAYLMIYRAIVVEVIEEPYNKLAEAQQNLAMSLRASNTGLWEWNVGSDVARFSPEWKAQLGYMPDELPDTFATWESLLHPDDRAPALQYLRDFLASRQKNYESEFRLRHRDGSHRWILARGEMQFNPQGDPLRLAGAHIDITGRRQSEALFNAAVEASPNGMIIVDTRGVIAMANSQTTILFGYSAEELQGRSINCLLPEPLHRTHSKHVGDFFAHMTKRQLGTRRDLFGQRKDGSLIQVEIGLSPLQINGQDMVLASVVDITERKRTLEQLRNTASELEHANHLIEAERSQLVARVEERTEQLQHANHAKDSFLATMSHEIRTPLGGLLGMMELLGLSRLDKEQHELLNAAQLSGKNLLRIVNDILDWSKIEAGKLELAPHAASLAVMLDGVAATYAQIASDKGIRFKVEIDPALSAAHLFDPLRLSQILNNFTSNALKFTEHGSVKLSAQRLAQHDGSETIRFGVQDTGIGIAPELQQRLFQNYEQANAETARMYGGTGLGLAICRRLAELMDGTLGVESSQGGGSTFSLTVELPVAVVAARQHPVQSADSNYPTTMDISPLSSTDHDIRILIVDDHPINRMLLKQQLLMLGVQVDAAVDGTGALARYQAEHFDLVITDCHMPRMDGYELTYRIRELEQQAGTPRIPVIAWTANVLAEEEERCHAAGMDDLLTKPTELADLRAILSKWLVKADVLPDAG